MDDNVARIDYGFWNYKLVLIVVFLIVVFFIVHIFIYDVEQFKWDTADSTVKI